MISSIIIKNIQIDILRLDEINAPISGNKYYKLKYNLEEANKGGFKTLLTFGGAFSNHLYAVALAGKEYGYRTIGIVRGEDDKNNPALQFCRQRGMDVCFISREKYALKYDASFLEELKYIYGKFYLIPEGGTNKLAVIGCAEILSTLNKNYHHIFCAVGTGGTLAGIISTPGMSAHITGISVLKGDDKLTKQVEAMVLCENKNWNINFDYHFGGYAKHHEQFIQFITEFENEYHILADPVYTGKMFYAISDMINKNSFTSSDRILAIHTGGLQGWDGWRYRYRNKF